MGVLREHGLDLGACLDVLLGLEVVEMGVEFGQSRVESLELDLGVHPEVLVGLSHVVLA